MEENMYKEAKILVVDDIEEVLSATKSTLKFEGMNVETYSNPLEALEFMKNNKIDVLLLDFFMPQMNGDKFIEELRKFNNETVIILRTGYSDKVPPMEMLDSLNIQGYIDKLKGDDELVLMTKSAIKTSYLYKQLLEQKRKIQKLEYNNEFMGKFFGKVLGQIREEAMVIGPLSDIMAKDDEIAVEDRKRYSSNINIAIGKLLTMTETMEFSNLDGIHVSKLKEIINKLFEIDLMIKPLKINFAYNDDAIINSDSKVLIYLLVEIIQYLLKENEDINININATNTIKIEIDNSISNNELINKLNNISKFDETISIEFSNNKLNIILS